jgi:trk system potassium uptake protein
MQSRLISHIVGFIMIAMGAVMLLPAAVDLMDGNPHWQAFVASSLVTLFIGGLLTVGGHEKSEVLLSIKSAFLLTGLCWIVVAAVGALPLLAVGLNYTDAFFESMSGLTTTGSTVISGLDQLPRGILLWRSLLNGAGGLGIIVMAIIMLPLLRVGGMQLFQSESSERSEKVFPRAAELVANIAAVYGVLIAACGVLYAIFGMTAFDALCHALTTVATGGFSTHDESFGFFKNPALEWIAVVFMMAGSIPFVLTIQAFRGRMAPLWLDRQVHAFVAFVVAVSLIMAVWLMITSDMSWLTALRLAAFNVVSIVTTTGYASADYTAWGSFAVGVFFILMFVGGCSGSTSGAIKTYRLQIMGLVVRRHFMLLTSPHRIVPITYNGRPLAADVPFSVMAFLAVYLALTGFFATILAALGLDPVTAISSSVQAMGNIGPGLGDIVGPAGNFATLPDAAKWILSFQMLLGRLELFTVLVLFMPEYWRSWE